jgi:hypothetical protein
MPDFADKQMEDAFKLNKTSKKSVNYPLRKFAREMSLSQHFALKNVGVFIVKFQNSFVFFYCKCECILK